MRHEASEPIMKPLDIPSIRVDFMTPNASTYTRRILETATILPTQRIAIACTAHCFTKASEPINCCGVHTVSDQQAPFEEIHKSAGNKLPISQIAAFYWVMVGKTFWWGRIDKWDDLFVEESLCSLLTKLVLLVRYPLERRWVTCLGKPALAVSR